ncbi:hypothetical protein D5S18_05940 [Nocardia panacis]|uniref:Uncharacterized protein n=1 Tax=Nocardia panacis TaxID=2340916 RepID=A0A3A4L6M6_9NOCA|nr:hypothetical protein [Nocardia panacis]RJO78426.1 hypothetical protein D5S18_05940 [Nocardia panacis]
MRIQRGVSPLEIWFHDRSDGPVRLDLDYCGYLEALVRTKGCFGWQYLFADVSLADHEHHHSLDNMRRMLEVFPKLFPEHDYTDLAERLNQRL